MTESGSRNRLIIGVDGGGTKTDALLASIDGDGAVTILGRGRGGPSNMRLCGKEETLASLDAAVRAATAGHLDPEHPADIAVLGLAGSEFSDVQADLAAELVRVGLDVWITNQRSLAEILDVIRLLGRVVDAADDADALGVDAPQRFGELRPTVAAPAPEYVARETLAVQPHHDPAVAGQ